jgi:hypothetical protein
MRNEDSHISDQELLLEVEGELNPRAVKNVRTHLAACWTCRARRQELEDAIGAFVRAQQRTLDADLPPIAGPRALLRAQLTHLSAARHGKPTYWFRVPRKLTLSLAASVLLIVGLFFWKTRHWAPAPPEEVVVSIPDSRLTPGATLLMTRTAVCALANDKNKAVPVALQKEVFAEYRIKKAKPQAYEVDYLVTPALGGADDIHNLWPHSYSAAWNARVKDALEDRLRDMVCAGSLDLTEAQQEIAANWIAAYKKYFHTDRPLVTQ